MKEDVKCPKCGSILTGKTLDKEGEEYHCYEQGCNSNFKVPCLNKWCK